MSDELAEAEQRVRAMHYGYAVMDTDVDALELVMAEYDRRGVERDQLQARVQRVAAAYIDLEAHRPPARLRARVELLTAALTEIADEAERIGRHERDPGSAARGRLRVRVAYARAALAAAVERNPE